MLASPVVCTPAHQQWDDWGCESRVVALKDLFQMFVNLLSDEVALCTDLLQACCTSGIGSSSIDAETLCGSLAQFIESPLGKSHSEGGRQKILAHPFRLTRTSHFSGPQSPTSPSRSQKSPPQSPGSQTSCNRPWSLKPPSVSGERQKRKSCTSDNRLNAESTCSPRVPRRNLHITIPIPMELPSDIDITLQRWMSLGMPGTPCASSADSRFHMEANGNNRNSRDSKNSRNSKDGKNGSPARPNGEGTGFNLQRWKAQGGREGDDVPAGGAEATATARSEPSLEPETRSTGLPWFPEPERGNLRQRVFLTLEDDKLSRVGKFISWVLVTGIAVSTVAFALESMPSFREVPPECLAMLREGRPLTAEACEPQPFSAFFSVEAVCIVLFTIDYVLRIATVHAFQTGLQAALLSTLRYALQPINVIDLFAICPFYLDLFLHGFNSIRAFRLLRILRIFKVAKRNKGIQLFSKVMIMSGRPLMILCFFNLIMAVLFASAMYFAEGTRYSVSPKFTDPQDGQPLYSTGVIVRKDATLTHDEISPFRSIPYALWWVFVTTTTVGYGDMSPTTPLGKVIGVACFYTGIVFLALPIGVLCTNFEMIYSRELEARGVIEDRSNSRKEAAKRLAKLRASAQPVTTGCSRIRRVVFITLEDPMANRLANILSGFIMITIIFSCIIFVMETTPDFRHTLSCCTPGNLTVEDCMPVPDDIFYKMEVVCIIIFSFEYALRVLTVHSVLPHECGLPQPLDGVPYTPLKITGLYVTQGLNMVDAFAIAPFYIELASGSAGGSIGVLRVLRLIRIFRVLRMPKMKACTDMFVEIIYEVMPALLILFSMTSLTCVLFSALIVFAEGASFSVDHFQDAYPHGLYIRPTKEGYDVEPSPFVSIPHSFWWFFTTATTVGYGDDYPTSTPGRFVAILAFYTGIILFALPITIIGGAFNRIYPEFLAVIE